MVHKRLFMCPKKKQDKQTIDQYTHPDKKRTNNPPVGLVTPETDKDDPKIKYQYDHHLDPQLVWMGKGLYGIPSCS